MGWVSVIKRPIANVNTLWTTYDYTNIDDVVEDPTAGSGDIISADDTDDTEEQIYDLALVNAANTLSLYSIDQVIVKVYGNYGGASSQDADVRVKIGSNWTSQQSLGLPATAAWVTKTFNGSWNVADFMTTFQIGLQASVTKNSIDIDVVYVILKGYSHP